MKKILLLMMLLFPLMLSAQDVWVEGTEWVVTYSEGDTHTQVLSGHAKFDETEYLILRDEESGEPVGYVRSERGDTMVYARGIIDGVVTEEFLLYDFGTFEPGTSFRYSAYDYETDEIVLFNCEIEADALIYYHDVMEDGDIFPCFDDVIFKVGCIGSPMDLFYNGCFPCVPEDVESGDSSKPKTRNVSHLVFRPKNRKGIMIIPTDIFSETLSPHQVAPCAYNLQGLPVRPPFSGIVVINGKKIRY